MARDRLDLERAARAVEDFLAAVGAPVGEDPELEGTGAKVAAAFAHELLAGYDMDPVTVLAETTATTTPGLVVLTDLPVTITCPHHLMPGQGVAHVGYLPGERVAGFGAIGRLVEGFARRLTLQETLGQEVADALVRHLGARAAGCVVDVTPTCLTARASRLHGARAVTVALAGDEAAFSASFLGRIPAARSSR